MIVHPGAFAFFGPVKLVRDRIIDDARIRLAVALECVVARALLVAL